MMILFNMDKQISVERHALPYHVWVLFVFLGRGVELRTWKMLAGTLLDLYWLWGCIPSIPSFLNSLALDRVLLLLFWLIVL